MRVIGLTGGVGMGKSTAADILRRRGLPVVDTDLLARQFVEPGQPALMQIRETFGASVIAEDGSLRRAELAKLVFGNAQNRSKLEAILHPCIRAAWMEEVHGWRLQNLPCGVVVIPLLFETHAESSFDSTICIACSRTSQEERLESRGWSGGEINQRIQAQWPIEKKMLLSNFVVWTESGLDVHEEQLTRILPLK